MNDHDPDDRRASWGLAKFLLAILGAIVLIGVISALFGDDQPVETEIAATHPAPFNADGSIYKKTESQVTRSRPQDDVRQEVEAAGYVGAEAETIAREVAPFCAGAPEHC